MKSNEFEQLFKKLKEDSKPSNNFRYTLKAKMLKKYESKGFIIDFFNSIFDSKFIPIFSIGSIAMLFIIGFIWINFFQNTQIIISEGNKEVSGELKTQIIQKFYINNQNNDINLINSKNIGFTIEDINEIDNNQNSPINKELWKINTVGKTFTYNSQANCIVFDKFSNIKNSISELAINKSTNQFMTYTKLFDYTDNLVSYSYTDNIDNIFITDNYNFSETEITDNIIDFKLTEITQNENKKYIFVRDFNLEECNLRVEIEIDGKNYKINEIKYYLMQEEKSDLILSIKFTYSESFNLLEDIKNRFKVIENYKKELISN